MIEYRLTVDKVKNKKKDHTVGTVPKTNIKIADRCKIDTPNTRIDDLSVSLLGTSTSI